MELKAWQRSEGRVKAPLGNLFFSAGGWDDDYSGQDG